MNTFVGKIIEKHSMKMVLDEHVMGENKGDFDGGGSARDEKDCRKEGDPSTAKKQGRETSIGSLWSITNSDHLNILYSLYN